MPTESRAFARALRKALTPEEALLWRALRRQQMGVKWRRQQPMGPFVADFYCPQARLVVEVDGGQHGEERLEQDWSRNAWMEAQGYGVLRFWNRDIRVRLDAVMKVIRQSTEERLVGDFRSQTTSPLEGEVAGSAWPRRRVGGERKGQGSSEDRLHAVCGAVARPPHPAPRQGLGADLPLKGGGGDL